MKILTWNINGIRASKRCLKDVLDSLDADVICLQETKITRDMLDEPSAIAEGYNAYFSFSRKRSGYSGTANFCRDTAVPTGAEEGLSGQLSNQPEGSIGCLGNVGEFDEEELQSLDGEGRAVLTQHHIEVQEKEVREVVIINVYVPRAAERDDRWKYKLRFLALLQSRAESLLRQGRHVIVLGDINTTHKRIDHCDPSTQEFLRPDSRQWMDQFLRLEDRDPELAPVEEKSTFEAVLSDAEGGHFIDAFRFFHPQQTEAYTNWSTVTSARQTNYGKRLDYILVDRGLQDILEDCCILSDFEGSDHCPVALQLRCRPLSASKCPPLCTKFMPEFQGKQQKLLRFFSKHTAGQTQVGQRTGTENAASDDKGGNMNPQFCLSAGDRGTQNCQISVMSKPLLLSHSQQHENEHFDKKSPQKAPLKRTSSDKLADKPVKKKRGNGEKSIPDVSRAGGRQGNLLHFFRKSSGPASTTPSNVNSCERLQHGDVRSRSQDREQRPQTAGQPTSTSRGPHGSGNPKPSPTKLVLSSLSLIPCGQSQTSSRDCLGPAPTSSEPAQAVRQQDQNADKPQVCRPESPDTQTKAKCVWRSLLSGPPPPPPCKGHGEPCVLRTVKKAGPTKGRQFYVCARPEGHSSNKEARCDHFQWVNYLSAGKKKT